MTIDDVVLRTASTLGVLILTAARPRRPSTTPTSAVATALRIGAALIGMVLAFVQSFKRKALPALILTYGSRSNSASSPTSSTCIADGAAMQAVIGTMAGSSPVC
ncbi:membrane protein [Streptomyces purpurascens]